MGTRLLLVASFQASIHTQLLLLAGRVASFPSLHTQLFAERVISFPGLHTQLFAERVTLFPGLHTQLFAERVTSFPGLHTHYLSLAGRGSLGNGLLCITAISAVVHRLHLTLCTYRKQLPLHVRHYSCTQCTCASSSCMHS